MANEDDRDKLLRAVRERGCRYVGEIVEETGLARWVVHGVLDELVRRDLAKITERGGEQTFNPLD